MAELIAAEWRDSGSLVSRAGRDGASSFPLTAHRNQRRGSGWVPVGSSDFKSVVPAASCRKEGSTPLHSRHFKLDISNPDYET